MRNKVPKVSFETVRKLGLQLPNVEEVTMYGKPALKVGGKMFACQAAHKSAEADSLVVRADFDQRAEMLATDPDTYYITDHYRGYPAVLVRLSRITPGVLTDLLRMAYRFVQRENTQSAKRKRTGSARSRTA
jgi:hypothetical protein